LEESEIAIHLVISSETTVSELCHIIYLCEKTPPQLACSKRIDERYDLNDLICDGADPPNSTLDVSENIADMVGYLAIGAAEGKYLVARRIFAKISPNLHPPTCPKRTK